MEKSVSTKKKFTIGSVINFIAFVAIVFIGLAWVISKIFDASGSIAQALNLIAQVLSYTLVGYFSFLYVNSKRNWIYILVWAVALTLIVVSFVI